MNDVAIVGAGVLGCTLARRLAACDLDVVVLEEESDVGEGATKANSGLIHTGFHPKGGSLKGRSCVAGCARYDKIAAELDVPLRRIGGLYVAFGPGGMEKIEEKRERARKNGAGELEVISGDDARELEPRLSEEAIAALVAPTTGIISPFELVLATARNAAANGVEFRFGFKVEHVERSGDRWALVSAAGERVEARYVANMAGELAAVIDAQVHPADIVVRPRRGQFTVFDKQTMTGLDGSKEPIRHVLFQAQETDEGGTLLTPTVDGNLLAGPTSENVRSFRDNATTVEGLEHVKRVARKLVPDLDFGRVITQFAGIRANIVNVAKERKDFVVRRSAPGFVSALGIKNPGMTCAPELADLAFSLLVEEGMPHVPKHGFDPCAQGPHEKPFLRCDAGEQERLFACDSRHGHVVCRCENITEGDVRSCMHELIAPTTLDGLKRRLRCTMGRCQGAFCTPRIVAIMADELGCSPADVFKNERGGRIVKRRVK